jgi:methionyl aminopeptidase
MEQEALEKYKKAYEISEKVLEFALPLVRKDVKALEVAEKIEAKIFELGGKPAWPVNISINEIAAHHTPSANDTTIFYENDFVKVDIGVQVDGYIADRAFTVFVGHKTHPLIEAAKKATKEALKILQPGTKIFEISEVIENVVSSYGFNPIKNLAGHRLERYEQHAAPSIPNAKNKIQNAIEAGNVFAVEVFTTTGSGWVKESKPNSIYRFYQDKPVRMWEAKKILELSKTRFDRLPFCARWIKEFPPAKVEMALLKLLEVEAVEIYPPLREETEAPVAVWEDTKIVL